MLSGQLVEDKIEGNPNSLEKVPKEVQNREIKKKKK